MPTVIVPPASNANSYLTVAEAQTYFDSRAPVAGWENADSQEALVIMATRTLDMLLSGSRIYVPGTKGQVGYYRIGPRWSGAPTTTSQPLAWPRTGMYNRNGGAIADNVIPQDLKNATAELAGALGTKDLLVDDANAVAGISSVRAGSVSVSFDTSVAMVTKMIPDAVIAMLVPSWVLNETIEGAYQAAFDVV